MQRKTYAKNQSGVYFPLVPYAVIAKGLLFSFVLSILLIIVVSMIYYFSPLTENFVPYIIYGITLICIIFGSVYVGKRVEEKGWIRGGVTGFLYIAFLLGLGLLFLPDLSLDMNIIYRLIIGFSFGALGGILGINS